MLDVGIRWPICEIRNEMCWAQRRNLEWEQNGRKIGYTLFYLFVFVETQSGDGVTSKLKHVTPTQFRPIKEGIQNAKPFIGHGQWVQTLVTVGGVVCHNTSVTREFQSEIDLFLTKSKFKSNYITRARTQKDVCGLSKQKKLDVFQKNVFLCKNHFHRSICKRISSPTAGLIFFSNNLWQT